MQETEERNYVELIKQFMMDPTKEPDEMVRLRIENPDTYKHVLSQAKREFKQAEKRYVHSLDKEELAYYYSEPFGVNPRGIFPV